MLDQIRAKRNEVRSLVRRYNGRAVYVLGLCARKGERPDSDIDFLVDFESGTTLFRMADLQDELRALFNRPIDLITEKSLKQDSFGVRVRANPDFHLEES